MLILILICMVYGILCSLPIYAIVNFILWTFNISFHLTLLQSFGVSMLLGLIRCLICEKEEK